MRPDEYRVYRRGVFKQADEVTAVKQAAYEASLRTDRPDALGFFKVAAAMEGRKPAEVAYSGLVQSVIRLGNLIKGAPDGGEPVQRQVEDAVNWVALLGACEKEAEKK